jgi:hypothetical protein
MNTTIKFGLAALAVGAFFILLGKADNTTPIPGAYFKNKESQQLATIAVANQKERWTREADNLEEWAKALARKCSI